MARLNIQDFKHSITPGNTVTTGKFGMSLSAFLRHFQHLIVAAGRLSERQGFLTLQRVIWSMCDTIEYQMHTKFTHTFQTKNKSLRNLTKLMQIKNSAQCSGDVISV